MPQQSRYSNDEFETLMNNVILTLGEGGANRDLSYGVRKCHYAHFKYSGSP